MNNQKDPLDLSSDEETDGLDAREGWMWAGKNAYIFLIDATDLMFEKDINDSSPFTMCIEACKEVMLKKIFGLDKDLISIILYGTKHKGQTAQPNHVTILQDLSQPNADKIKDLMSIIEDVDSFEQKHGHSDDFSLAEALWLCHKIISNCSTKISEKTIFLMTCNDNPHAADAKLQHDTRTRAGNLAEMGIRLEILPVGVTFNIEAFFKEIRQITHENDDGDDMSTHSKEIKIIRSVDDIVQIFHQSIKKRSCSRVLWSLGSDVKIGIAAYSFVKSISPTLKKIALERSKNTVVTSRTQAFNAETGEEVVQAEVSKAVKVSGKTVLFEKEELRNSRQVTQPGLILLGFKPISRINILLQRKESLFIYPDERRVKGSRTLFAALYDRCLGRQMAALCYFTARRSSKPSLVALLPLAEKLGKDGTQHIPPGFVLRFLPYADNIRDLTAVEVKCPDPEPELIHVCEKIIDSIKFKYHTSLIDNPKLSKMWSGIEALALGYEEPKEFCDHTLPDYDRIDSKIDHLAEDFMNIAFPGGFDNDALAKAVKRAAAPKQPPAKRVKPDLENSSMEEIARQNQVEKLTVDKLKQYLIGEGVSGFSKMKKAELVNAVYRHLQMDEPSTE